MQTDDNSNNENLVDTDLEAFEKDFFQKEDTKPAEEVDESNEIEDDSLATDDDTDAPAETGDDEPDEEGDDEEAASEEEKAPEEEPAPKKGKKSFQERINELTAKAREAERREADALRQLAERNARSNAPEVKTEPEPTPALREILPPDAPSPDEADSEGMPKYPLGEFDPLYIRDLTKFTIVQETAAAREQEQQRATAEAYVAEQQKLAASWAKKVETAEVEIPDIRENISSLATQFQGIDPQYGDYLASTIMESERGPEIMNYLSQNIGEAQAIVASGPRAATLAIGRLEQKLAKTESNEEESSNEKRVSNAPAPPSRGSRGSGARTTIRPDTDNLDAFEKIFFK